MGKYLVTGRSGSGKSEVCRELQKRGRNAFDGDKVTDLVSWRDPVTNQKIEVDYSKVLSPSRAVWNWQAAELGSLLETKNEVFLCGSADNQLTFHALFDKVFVLTLDPETQTARLVGRTEHDYGKSPEMQLKIIKEQAVFVHQALELGATAINSAPQVEKVVDDILEHVHEN